jgi:hypothetical protein
MADFEIYIQNFFNSLKKDLIEKGSHVSEHAVSKDLADELRKFILSTPFDIIHVNYDNVFTSDYKVLGTVIYPRDNYMSKKGEIKILSMSYFKKDGNYIFDEWKEA